MTKYKPVSISTAAFRFCRLGIAVLIWLSFFLQSKLILAAVCLLFLLSIILKVGNSPLIRFYDSTLQRLHKRTETIVNEHAIFFAHCLGFTFSAICLLLVSLVSETKIWNAVLIFAVLKTISAMGFCPAAKLYECSMNGNCCVKKKKNG